MVCQEKREKNIPGEHRPPQPTTGEVSFRGISGQGNGEKSNREKKGTGREQRLKAFLTGQNLGVSKGNGGGKNSTTKKKNYVGGGKT